MARRRKDGEFWESATYNSQGFRQYYNRLTELSVSMFEWKNLPDDIDPRFLELTLFGDGMAVFFKDEVMDKFLCLRTMIGGRLNVYQIPTIRTAYATNGYRNELDESNSVIIFNNMLHTNSVLDVEVFARRLWDLDRTIDVNAKAQKTPILIQCEETQRLVMKNLYMKYDGNVPFIFASNNFDPNSLKVLKTDAPYVADRLYDLREKIWNEALGYLGITSAGVTKKERVSTVESTQAQGSTIANRYSRLNERRQACEKINAMFGLNVEVNYRSDFDVNDSEDEDEYDADVTGDADATTGQE